MADAVTARLEAVAARLESVARKLGGGGGGDDDDEVPMYVTDYEAFVKKEVNAAIAASKKIGLEEAANHLLAAYNNTLELVRRVPNSKKPAPKDLMAFLKPCADAIGALDTMKYKGKNTKKFGDHYKAMSEAATSCSWVMMAPPAGLPKQHVDSQAGSVDFNINRVCKNNKDDDTKAWKGAMQAMNKKLCEFVKEYFKSSGLTYNPKGADLNSATAAVSAAPAKAEEKKEAAPAKKAKKGGGGMANVMGDLRKGLNVTKGMKKVTSDMKTKNRKVRAGKVTMKTKVSKKRKKFGVAQTKMMGGRWMVENYEAEDGLIVIEKANVKSNVFISMCDGCTIQVPGKVKAVTIDNCVKVRVFVQDVVSTVELVNCKSVKIIVQKDGKVPSFTVDKCDSPQIILSKSAAEANPDIYSSNVSAMNVEVPGKTEDEDNKEYAIPEQFLTKIDFKTGECTTRHTEH